MHLESVSVQSQKQIYLLIYFHKGNWNSLAVLDFLQILSPVSPYFH